jgi:hypothetical protein
MFSLPPKFVQRAPSDSLQDGPLVQGQGKEQKKLNSLVPAGSGFIETRETRATSRALARMESRHTLKQAQIQDEAELQVDRVQAVGYVGQQGMQVVALVSQMEGNLATLVPMATSRLQAIGDLVALEVADVVSQTPRRVR